MVERNNTRYILRTAILLLLSFSCLALYVVYLQVWEADRLAEHPLNRRAALAEDSVLRGSILDRKGEVLALSPNVGERRYPYGRIMAPVTGYLDDTIGSTGIEAYKGAELSGHSRLLGRLGPLAQIFASARGDDVYLTLDAALQETAYEALGERRGAVVMLDAESGAVLVLASRPSFDPSDIQAQWNSLRQDKESPLVNRALQGLYPPGSTIKPLILDAALENGVTNSKEVFDCTGALKVGDSVIHESHGAAHGRIDVEHALIESCNTTFGSLALRLGGKKLADAFRRFGFEETAQGELAEAAAHLPDFASLGQGDTAQIGIGQSTLLVTPLHMALLAAAFANGGVVMKPYMVERVVTPNGVTLEQHRSEKWFEATTAARASLIHGFMEEVVQEGTGTAAALRGVRVAGKTGTAENSGEDHAWFIGSAEIKGRKVAFAILVENSGGGGTEAAPIARKLLEKLQDD